MDLPDSYRIARVPHYSGTLYASLRFGYRTITVYGGRFHVTSPRVTLAMSRALQPQQCLATLPVWARPRSIASTRGITKLFSLPMGTKMFQFPTFAPSYGWWQASLPGCPIRISADQVVFADPRSFSQLITSFVASQSQGIHRMPFFRFIYIFTLSNIYRKKCLHIDNSTRLSSVTYVFAVLLVI